MKLLVSAGKTTRTQNLFSQSHQINPKSDCIYHIPIDLDPNGRIHLVPNQLENGENNLISV